MKRFPPIGKSSQRIDVRVGPERGVAITLRNQGTRADRILGRRQKNKASEVGECYLAKAQGILRSEWKIWLSWGREGVGSRHQYGHSRSWHVVLTDLTQSCRLRNEH